MKGKVIYIEYISPKIVLKLEVSVYACGCKGNNRQPLWAILLGIRLNPTMGQCENEMMAWGAQCYCVILYAVQCRNA